jgi:hypothetical protein
VQAPRLRPLRKLLRKDADRRADELPLGPIAARPLRQDNVQDKIEGSRAALSHQTAAQLMLPFLARAAGR